MGKLGSSTASINSRYYKPIKCHSGNLSISHTIAHSHIGCHCFITYTAVISETVTTVISDTVNNAIPDTVNAVIPDTVYTGIPDTVNTVIPDIVNTVIPDTVN